MARGIQATKSAARLFSLRWVNCGATFGTHIAALAYQYGLDVEADLASILPPSNAS
jgi:hypothetical protein